MTKLRAPLSFAQAIKRIGGVVEFKDCAALVGRSVRAVQLWSEDDRDGCPTLEQAFALDLAYRKAGGEGAPILESYAAQLDVAIADELACRTRLIAIIGDTAQECGEAYKHALVVAMPGATPAEVHRAITETEEAAGRITALLRSLTRFLKPAGVAGAGTMGGTQL